MNEVMKASREFDAMERMSGTEGGAAPSPSVPDRGWRYREGILERSREPSRVACTLWSMSLDL
jgi:hypothetical protein